MKPCNDATPRRRCLSENPRFGHAPPSGAFPPAGVQRAATGGIRITVCDASEFPFYICRGTFMLSYYDRFEHPLPQGGSRPLPKSRHADSPVRCPPLSACLTASVSRTLSASRPVRWRRCKASRPRRSMPPPTASGGVSGTTPACRTRGRSRGIFRPRTQRKRGCVFVPQKSASGIFCDHFEQPRPAGPSHSACSLSGSHSETPATPCGRSGLGIRGVCDAGLRPCLLHLFHAVARHRTLLWTPPET